MPFRLKLKKSRQYNVASKSVCVLSVELLDNTVVECTLAYSSLGKECLHSVCQRLGLLQVEFFGLKFVSKRGGFWWVDLDRPLKKQLDKYALEPQLYLGVMFFVQDVRMLEDEVTRYHYFLQLKSDIIDGHLKCTPKQAVLLASYSLQAEFGLHDPERHTTEYLANFALLPKSLVTDKETRETLMEQVILSHGALRDIPPACAELLYIQEAQNLERYGQQLFSAKDQNGAPLYIGASMNGIFIRPTSLQPASSFRWNEIVNLVHHRKYFGIECHQTERSVQYNLEDNDYAKYVWKMCAKQHKFYSRRFSSDADFVASYSSPLSDDEVNQNCSVTEERNLVASQESLDELGVYHTEEFPSSESFGTQLSTSTVIIPSTEAEKEEEPMNIQPQIIAPPQDPLLLSRLSLTPPQIPEFVALDARRALLPSYRQAPDYETALRYKHSGSSQGDVSVSSSGGRVGDTLTDSQQSDLQMNCFIQQPHYRNYVDLSHLDSNACVNSSSNNQVQVPSQGTSVPLPYSNLMMPPTHTYSSPELHWLPSELSVQQVLQLSTLQCKSPPPYYTGNQWQQQRPCSSTPDLTRNKQVVSTSPDLVSRRHLHHLRHSTTPGQYMTAVEDTQVHRASSESQIMIHNTGGSSGRRPPPPSYSVAVQQQQQQGSNKNAPMGPLLVAAMNGLSLSPPDIISVPDHQGAPLSRDLRILLLESRLQEGQFFLEFEQIPKKRPISDFQVAVLPENLPRNRFKDVLPYEDNRVRLMPTKDNHTGYINASHISITVGGSQRFYIAAQGPLPHTVHSFWQMIWEHRINLIVMLTETEEQGREKCHPYWPQNDNTQVQIGEFQISRSYSVSSSTFITCSLVLVHLSSRTQRTLWHIQYTDWPDHGCPQHLQGFLSFMEEIDQVRRLSSSEQPPGRGRNAPVLVHCSAGVGRSGVVILCDLMLYALDHASEPLDMPKMLTQLRYQRMMTVQTVAQYKFVYSVLIQYLKNSRLI